MQKTERALAGASGYRVVPLAVGHTDDAAMLERVLRERAHGVPDPRRDGFYWIEMDRSRFYVNVHDATRTVYLLTVEGRGMGAVPLHSEATF